MNEENKPINPNPADKETIEKAIKACAYVGGQTKTEILKTIKEEWLYGHEERIKDAQLFLWALFNGREKMPRKVVRAGRRENNMTFAEVVRKKLRNS